MNITSSSKLFENNSSSSQHHHKTKSSTSLVNLNLLNKNFSSLTIHPHSHSHSSSQPCSHFPSLSLSSTTSSPLTNISRTYSSRQNIDIQKMTTPASPISLEEKDSNSSPKIAYSTFEEQLRRVNARTKSVLLTDPIVSSDKEAIRSMIRSKHSIGIRSSDYPNYLFQQGLYRSRTRTSVLSASFYLDSIHADVWNDANFLERAHTYIQWLFPISEGSGMNPDAFQLTLEEATRISTCPVARESLFRSFVMMLNFWGFQLDFIPASQLTTSTSPLDTKFGAVFPDIIPIVQRPTTDAMSLEQQQARFSNWDGTHNSLRISRVLRSLSECGLHSIALPFAASLLYHALVGDVKNVTSSLYRFWLPSLDPILAKALQSKQLHTLLQPSIKSRDFNTAMLTIHNYIANCKDIHPLFFLMNQSSMLSNPKFKAQSTGPNIIKSEATVGGAVEIAQFFINLVENSAENTSVENTTAKDTTSMTDAETENENKSENATLTKTYHAYRTQLGVHNNYLAHSASSLAKATENAKKLSENVIVQQIEQFLQTSKSTTSTNSPFSACRYSLNAPDFTRITEIGLYNVIKYGMKQQLSNIDSIVNNSTPPTLENTIIALEKSAPVLDMAYSIFSALESANTSPSLQLLNAEIAPILTNHSDSIYLSQPLFTRVRALYDAMNKVEDNEVVSTYSSEDKRIIDRTYNSFVRAGAALTPEEREKICILNTEESKLKTKFSDVLLAATRDNAIIVDDISELAGLSSSEIAVAKEAAISRGLHDKYVLVLSNTTLHPILGSLENRNLRLRLQKASEERCCSGGNNDTRAIVSRLATLRAQKAYIFKEPSYAALCLKHQMASSEENARDLLEKTRVPAVKRAKKELEKLQIHADLDCKARGVENFNVTSADWDYYANKVQKAEYDFDTSEMKPYFELFTVLEKGVFFVAERLYGIRFEIAKDIPSYHPDVIVYRVVEDINSEDGTSTTVTRAIFYLDPYARDSKQGGAWCTSFIQQDGLTGALPVLCNVENYAKPADSSEPCLLDWDDIITLFHEAGHGLHGIFSNTKYPSLAGLNVPSDFVELPSQVNENWASHPEVLHNYAIHYQTGEHMPIELIEKMKRCETFNKGYTTVEYLQASLLDLAWHSLPAQEDDTVIVKPEDVEEFEKNALLQAGFDTPAVPVRYKSTIFAHVFCSMYASGYYAYLWSEWLDQDAYVWFQENNGLNRKAGDYFREKILSIGNTKDVAVAYRDFRGAEPDITPLLKKRGLLGDF